ncbi:MAG: D-alanyl-D-alanine carboxypeptidase/D-alanyl-D-alanine-endopeptidase [Candidatus Sumerlaeia bacterium]|nr:D-alanyl-D-alanine carboxypeptidase/D-alanyl-D-alanine-endopeptidase [Candidatus Sumerlaeia bacterium]
MDIFKKITDEMGKILAEVTKTPAHWGVRVETIDGTVLVDYQGSKAFVPASNMKLVTTLAALDLLGADFQWETTLLTHGIIEGDTLYGDLLLRGSGDPTIAPWDHETGSFRVGDVYEWVKILGEKGIRRIMGAIMVDHGGFASEFFHPSWEIGLTSDSDASGTSGFAITENAFRYTITPGHQPGHAPHLTVDPMGVASLVDADLHTVEPGQEHERLLLGRRDLEQTIHFQGNIASGAEPINNRAAIPAPSLHHDILMELFREGGIEVLENGTSNLQDAETILHVHKSPPLREAVYQCNKWSNNFIAEQLCRTIADRMGKESTWAEGIRITRDWLGKINIPDLEHLRIEDGSGLARKNSLQPRQLCALIRHGITEEKLRSDFAPSLPSREQPNPLTKWFPGIESVDVHAKTGSLEGTRALSGFINREGGETLVFSIMVNQYFGDQKPIDGQIARILQALGG